MEAVAEKSKKKKKKNVETSGSTVKPEEKNISKSEDDVINCTEIENQTNTASNPENLKEHVEEFNSTELHIANECSQGELENDKIEDKEHSLVTGTSSVAKSSSKEAVDLNIQKIVNSGNKENVVKDEAEVDSSVEKNVNDCVKNEHSKRVTSFEEYLNINKNILLTIESINSIPAQVNSTSKKTVEKEEHGIKEHIKPYTEQQLIALYHNSELDRLEIFNSSFVEAELKGLPVKQHILYDLLEKYLKVKEKITGNNLELDQLRKEYKDLQNNLWSLETATVTGRAECQDGQIVSASHSYNRSIFHRSVFQNIVRILGNIQKLLFENNNLYSYSAEDLKLQIELYIQSIIINLLTVTNLNVRGPVSLSIQEEPIHLKPYLGEIRLSISVLFAFQRKLIRDCQFITETREWLTKLVAVLLRIANFQDHLFLINHILRCPAGVGNWAASFLQVPLRIDTESQPFANTEVNHLLTLLSVILRPVKERNQFLNDFVFAAILAVAFAAPKPEADPKAEAKPWLASVAYSAPLVAAPALPYAYSAPLAYSSYVAAPSVYASAYTSAYSAYPAVVV